MSSQLRVNQITNRSGLSTVTFSDTGTVLSGITTVDGSFTISQQPFYHNSPTITQNYTVKSEYNSMSIGPIGISSGITVTVESGAFWTIV